MKYVIRKQCFSQSRLGLLLYELTLNSELQNGLNKETREYETPICFQYTVNGSIPHIVWDIASDVRDDNSPLLLTLPTTIDMNESVRNFNKTTINKASINSGLLKFAGIDTFRHSFLAMQDPLRALRTGQNSINGTAVFSRGGKKVVNAKLLLDIVSNFRPNGYQAVCDSDTDANSNQKRVNKSVDRTLTFLDECVEAHNDSQEVKNNDTGIYGTIEGGFDYDIRIRSAKETALRPLDGFIIDGFHTNGPQTETGFDIEPVIPILVDVMKYLPGDKPRAMFGAFRPNVIINLIKNGIDIFDSSYATVISERGHALLPIIDMSEIKLNNLTLDLNSEAYKLDVEPIQSDCQCYTCINKFTKAYIHHLSTSKEMLALVLLMFHNLHVFYEFFRQIRQLMNETKFELLLKKL